MNTMELGLLACVFVLVGSLVLAVLQLTRPSAARQRLREWVDPDGAQTDHRFVETVTTWVDPVSRLAIPEEGIERSNVKRRFAHAGIRHPSAPTLFFGVKAILALGLPALAIAALALTEAAPDATNLMLALIGVAALGYYLPNLALARRIASRQREIFENFPDALDLMTVCVEAGLGTEAAMMRVAEDLHFKSPALAEELRLVNLELRAGADRQMALRNLATRTGVDEVDSFVSMINQAERFGTSIAASLRVHSDLLRTRRRQRAEEAAAKIALKLLFPLIFCIFPALMVVLMGPAMIQIQRVLLPTLGGQ